MRPLACRPLLALSALFLLALPIAAAPPLLAAEVWTVRAGFTTFHLNEELLEDLGLELREVQGDVDTPAHLLIERPHWTFDIGTDSDLSFQVDRGVPVPSGIVGGAIRHQGLYRFVDTTSGASWVVDQFEIAYLAPEVHVPADGVDANPLYIRSADGHGPIFFDLVYSMFELGPSENSLSIHYLNVKISDQWAMAMGRPELAGWVVGGGEVRAVIEHVSGSSSGDPYVPQFGGGDLDVKLGMLNSVQQVGHLGSYPDGTAGLSMATTSCNVGDVDVPWLAPMQEDHPAILMALYRGLDGRFEQIGLSWMKHGFFALSNSQCTPCQHPSGGTFLGVGCSDTYGVYNNSDRQYLGPREEWDAYVGTWECTGSHFADGQPDCVRRHGGQSSHSSVDHRVQVQDADLDNPGATYYYEAYYLVHDDVDRHNNWGSRRCTMSWQGGAWDFVTPNSSNPLVEGPALARWAGVPTYASVPGDGQVLLSVTATDLGGGTYQYEYALLNMDVDHKIRSFSLPVAGVPGISSLGFHDADADPSNDWPVSLVGDVLTWATTEYPDPDAAPLEFGSMINFRFTADAEPVRGDATLGIHEPGVAESIVASTSLPSGTSAGIADPADSPPVTARLLPVRPNPLDLPGTTLPFELAAPTVVELAIYDAGGRHVRTLIEGPLDGGRHTVTWDGRDGRDRRVGSGVYYARLRAGDRVAVRSMVVID